MIRIVCSTFFLLSCSFPLSPAGAGLSSWFLLRTPAAHQRNYLHLLRSISGARTRHSGRDRLRFFTLFCAVVPSLLQPVRGQSVRMSTSLLPRSSQLLASGSAPDLLLRLWYRLFLVFTSLSRPGLRLTPRSQFLAGLMNSC
ncbi:hypothetical protein NQD34_007887 [Periophthalmus magnuspinnatus]|nr:hypothetical protein NQD34_007887 [Periophthalmus magnuspinnatus]